VVAGQTFYLFTLENLKQFGALKAIGVTKLEADRHGAAAGIYRWVMGFGWHGMAAAFFEMTLQKIATRGIILSGRASRLQAAASCRRHHRQSLSIRRVVVLETAAVFRG